MSKYFTNISVSDKIYQYYRYLGCKMDKICLYKNYLKSKNSVRLTKLQFDLKFSIEKLKETLDNKQENLLDFILLNYSRLIDFHIEQSINYSLSVVDEAHTKLLDSFDGIKPIDSWN